MTKQKSRPLFSEAENEKVVEHKQSEFIGELLAQKILDNNEYYFRNVDIGINFSLIKKLYNTYVVNSGWSEDKYQKVLETIIRRYEPISNKAILRAGIDYDKRQENNQQTNSIDTLQLQKELDELYEDL